MGLDELKKFFEKLLASFPERRRVVLNLSRVRAADINALMTSHVIPLLQKGMDLEIVGKPIAGKADDEKQTQVTGTFVYDVMTKSMTLKPDDGFYGSFPIRAVPDEDYCFRGKDGNPMTTIPVIRLALNPKAEKFGEVMMMIAED